MKNKRKIQNLDWIIICITNWQDWKIVYLQLKLDFSTIVIEIQIKIQKNTRANLEIQNFIEINNQTIDDVWACKWIKLVSVSMIEFWISVNEIEHA